MILDFPVKQEEAPIDQSPTPVRRRRTGGDLVR